MPRLTAIAVLLLASAFYACGDDESPSTTPDGSGGGDSGSGDAMGSGDTGEGSGDEAASWGASCADDAECSGVSDYCVVQPGDDTGYCGARCATTSACGELGAPEGWTCNSVEMFGCDDLGTNWCAPPEELVDNGEFLIECAE